MKCDHVVQGGSLTCDKQTPELDLSRVHTSANRQQPDTLTTDSLLPPAASSKLHHFGDKLVSFPLNLSQ